MHPDNYVKALDASKDVAVEFGYRSYEEFLKAQVGGVDPFEEHR